jgi:Peptidase M15
MAATVPPARLIERFRPQMLQLARFYVTAKNSHPIKLTSWWRSKAHNASVGGEDTSQHLVGTAIDFVGVPLADAVAIARPLGLTAIASNRGAVHVQALASGTVARLVRADPSLLS